LGTETGRLNELETRECSVVETLRPRRKPGKRGAISAASGKSLGGRNGWWRTQSQSNRSPLKIPSYHGNKQGNPRFFAFRRPVNRKKMSVPESLIVKFPMGANRELKLLQQGISYAHLGFLAPYLHFDGVQKLFGAYPQARTYETALFQIRIRSGSRGGR
jgi:hypothetical protein